MSPDQIISALRYISPELADQAQNNVRATQRRRAFADGTLVPPLPVRNPKGLAALFQRPDSDFEMIPRKHPYLPHEDAANGPIPRAVPPHVLRPPAGEWEGDPRNPQRSPAMGVGPVLSQLGSTADLEAERKALGTNGELEETNPYLPPLPAARPDELVSPVTSSLGPGPNPVGSAGENPQPMGAPLPMGAPMGDPRPWMDQANVSGPVTSPSVQQAAPTGGPTPAQQTAPEGEGWLASLSPEDKWLALAQAGAKMAQAAGTPGATFLGALGAGADTGISALYRAKKDKETKADREFQKDIALQKLGIDKYNAASSRIKARLEKKPELMRIAEFLYGDDIEAQKNWIREEKSDAERSTDLERALAGKVARGEMTQAEADNKLIELRASGKSEAVAIAELILKRNKNFDEVEAKASGEALSAGQKAIDARGTVVRLQDHLLNRFITGETPTGVGSQLLVSLNSAVGRFTAGLDSDLAKFLRSKVEEASGLSPDKLNDSKFFSTFSRTLVQGILESKAFGANPSNADLNLILSIIPNLDLDPDTNLRLAAHIEDKSLGNVETALMTWRGMQKRGIPWAPFENTVGNIDAMYEDISRKYTKWNDMIEAAKNSGEPVPEFIVDRWKRYKKFIDKYEGKKSV